MKAMVLSQFHKPLTWQDVPDPQCSPFEVIVEVKANGLCATDLKIMEGLVPTVPLPHIPGHEVAGEVVAVGSELTDLHPGDRGTGGWRSIPLRDL